MRIRPVQSGVSNFQSAALPLSQQKCNFKSIKLSVIVFLFFLWKDFLYELNNKNKTLFSGVVKHSDTSQQWVKKSNCHKNNTEYEYSPYWFSKRMLLISGQWLVKMTRRQRHLKHFHNLWQIQQFHCNFQNYYKPLSSSWRNTTGISPLKCVPVNYHILCGQEFLGLIIHYINWTTYTTLKTHISHQHNNILYINRIMQMRDALCTSIAWKWHEIIPKCNKNFNLLILDHFLVKVES